MTNKEVTMKRWAVALVVTGLVGTIYNFISASTVAQAQERLTLLEAVQQGKVKAEVSGAGLSAVSLTVQKMGKERIRIVVPVGTFFVNTGAAQNMITTTEAVIDLAGRDSATVAVAAACANFHQAEPDSASSFMVQSTADNPELDRLMKLIAKQHPSETVAQVAIWVVTDNPTREELDSTYQSSLSPFVAGSPAASDADIEAARKLLKEAGIDTTQKRLFR